MSEKYIPQRMCISCRQRRPKPELLRIVKNNHTEQSGGFPEIVVDEGQKIIGRGVYLCYDINCLSNAKKARRLERAFSCKIEDTAFNKIKEAITSYEQKSL